MLQQLVATQYAAARTNRAEVSTKPLHFRSGGPSEIYEFEAQVTDGMGMMDWWDGMARDVKSLPQFSFYFVRNIDHAYIP